jgi:hypothetical protein
LKSLLATAWRLGTVTLALALVDGSGSCLVASPVAKSFCSEDVGEVDDDDDDEGFSITWSPLEH